MSPIWLSPFGLRAIVIMGILLHRNSSVPFRRQRSTALLRNTFSYCATHSVEKARLCRLVFGGQKCGNGFTLIERKSAGDFSLLESRSCLPVQSGALKDDANRLLASRQEGGSSIRWSASGRCLFAARAKWSTFAGGVINLHND